MEFATTLSRVNFYATVYKFFTCRFSTKSTIVTDASVLAGCTLSVCWFSWDPKQLDPNILMHTTAEQGQFFPLGNIVRSTMG